jgi:hypothetical protein
VKPGRKRKERNERKKESGTPLSKAEKHRGRGVNSTNIARFHHRLPHHLHREHQQKEGKRNSEPAWPSFSVSLEVVTTGCA